MTSSIPFSHEVAKMVIKILEKDYYLYKEHGFGMKKVVVFLIPSYEVQILKNIKYDHIIMNLLKEKYNKNLKINFGRIVGVVECIGYLGHFEIKDYI